MTRSSLVIGSRFVAPPAACGAAWWSCAVRSARRVLRSIAYGCEANQNLPTSKYWKISSKLSRQPADRVRTTDYPRDNEKPQPLPSGWGFLLVSGIFHFFGSFFTGQPGQE